MKVLVILLNFARPHHMPRVIDAWRRQSLAPWKLVVVDNSPNHENPQEEFCCWGTDDCHPDDVWRMTENHHCSIRFAPALFYLGYDYVLFADDDLLPGCRALEHAVRHAELMKGQFTTLGWQGRRFVRSGPTQRKWLYNAMNVKRDDVALTPVDLTCRVNLTTQYNVLESMTKRHWLARHSRDKYQLLQTHEDMLLSMATNGLDRVPYLLPETDDPEQKLILTELPTGIEAVHRRPEHYRERQEMLDLMRYERHYAVEGE